MELDSIPSKLTICLNNYVCVHDFFFFFFFLSADCPVFTAFQNALLLKVLHFRQFMHLVITKKVLLHLILPRFMAFNGHASGFKAGTDHFHNVVWNSWGNAEGPASASAMLSKQISAGPLLTAHKDKILLTEATQLLVQIGKIVAHLYWLHRIFTYLSLVLVLYMECLDLREGGIPCYFEDLQHMVPHWLCSKPAYWLIWVISEENVTNLCRKCCNWISATRIIWSSSQESMWKPQLFADSEPTLFLGWPSNPAAASTFSNR